MIVRFVVTALALAFTASTTAGQSLTQVQPGTRIRVTQPVFIDGRDIGRVHRPQVGTLVSIDSTSITALLEKDGTLLTLPFSAINRLQISEGAQSGNRGRVRGMLKGALIGGGLAAVYYAVATQTHVFKECAPPENPAGDGVCKVGAPHMVPAIVGATIGGAAIGFGMGSRQREAWRDVDPRFVPIRARPSDLSLSVSLRF